MKARVVPFFFPLMQKYKVCNYLAGSEDICPPAGHKQYAIATISHVLSLWVGIFCGDGDSNQDKTMV